MTYLGLALADAKRNCKRENARATLTLCSGVQYTGKLASFDETSAHLHLERGAWVTITMAELAAVESTR